MNQTYEQFLDAKSQLGGEFGFEPTFMPDFLFPFQRALIEWACRKGRSAIFADCGLGKTPMQLVWAQNVVEKTCKPVLILTPLSVGAQTIREAVEDVGLKRGRTLRGEGKERVNGRGVFLEVFAQAARDELAGDRQRAGGGDPG